MKTPLRRSLGAVAASAVLLGSALAGPAQATPGDGKGEVVVDVVDAAGRPATGIIGLVQQGQTLPGSGMITPGFASSISGSFPAARYGVWSMTPWGGFTCAGLTPCGMATLSGGLTTDGVTGAFTLADLDTPQTFTLKTPAPARITGGSAVGDALEVDWSTNMEQFFQSSYGGGTQATIAWLRDGDAIAGQDEETYQLVPGDVGHTISAVLAYEPGGVWGGTTPPAYSLAGVKATKRPTRTTADLFRKRLVRGQGTGLVVEVTSGKAAAADGRATVRVGTWKTTQAIRNGSARVALPKTLKPGRYQVTVTYLGSATYAGSAAKAQALTVIKKKRQR